MADIEEQNCIPSGFTLVFHSFAPLQRAEVIPYDMYLFFYYFKNCPRFAAWGLNANYTVLLINTFHFR